jgi:uncharacterized protein (DUF302 family)
MSDTISYGVKKEVDGGVEETEARVREALAAEGFGVLTEIDIAAAFKAKLDVDFRPYKILGACNPPLAHQALSEETDIGLLLPCNVVVYASDAPGRSIVAALDPVQQLGVAGRDDLGDMATEVRARLERAIAAV